jgi:hypothetical protein
LEVLGEEYSWRGLTGGADQTIRQVGEEDRELVYFHEYLKSMYRELEAGITEYIGGYSNSPLHIHSELSTIQIARLRCAHRDPVAARHTALASSTLTVWSFLDPDSKLNEPSAAYRVSRGTTT